MDDLPTTAAKTDPRLPLFVLLILGTLAGMKNTDASLGSITLPSAAAAFHLSAGMEAFVASVTTLALSASALPLGSLSDRVGRRRVLLLSLAVLVAGEVLAAAAPGAVVFAAGRAITGIGLGGLFSCSFGLVPAVAPGQLTSRGLGLWNGIMMPAALAMQLVGSLLALVDWRLAYLTLPLMAVPLFVASRTALPEPPHEARRGDPAALVAIAAAILVLLSGVSLVAEQPSSPWSWACVVAGLALFGIWVWLEKRSSHPTFPVALLRQPAFLGAIVAGLLFNSAFGVLTLQLANIWEYLRGFDALAVTAGLLPVTVVGAGGCVVVGRWLSRGVRPGTLMPPGLVICGVGFLTLLLTDLHSPYLAFLPAIVLVTGGIALVTVPQSNVFVSAAPPKFVGAVTSSRVTFGQLGYSVGVAASVAVLAAGADLDFPRLLAKAGVDPVRAGTALADVQMYAALRDDRSVAAGRAVVSAAASAYVAGFHLAMLVFGAACIAGAVAVALLSRRRATAAG